MAEIIEFFDRRECSDCPLNTRCKAGVVVSGVLKSMEEGLDSTFDSLQRVLVEAAIDNDDPRRFRILTRRMSKDIIEARDRYHTIGSALDMLMANVINAQGLPEIRELSVDDRTIEIEEILEEFASSPVAPSEIPTVQTMQASAEDAMGYFYEHDLCKQTGFVERQ